MSLELEGTVQNGVVVVEGDQPLPEGAKVKIILQPTTTLGERLKEFRGIAEGLPDDLAMNHDHYLYGTPKK